MRFAIAFLVLPAASLALAQPPIRVDFEDLSLPPESAYYGADNAGGFTSRGVFFNNNYLDLGGGFFAWSGFSYSNFTDTTTAGLGNQFSAYHLPGGGGDESPLYAVGFAFTRGEGFIELLPGYRPDALRITNTTYAALAMRDGDSFSKKFGGDTGLDPDFFSITFYGLDAVGNDTGSVTFILADYRPAGTANDYIISAWTEVDLSALGENTRRIEFDFESSDVGPFGINTPTYFALDNLALTAIPEPAAALLLPCVAALWLTRRARARNERAPSIK
jgi:hypothetical protein